MLLLREIDRAAAIIIKDSCVLLIHRWNKEQGDYFIVPGGGIGEGESPETAVTRELKEEAGIDICNLRTFLEYQNSTSYRKQYFFLADCGDQEPIWQEKHKQTPENMYELQWIELSTVKGINLVPQILKEKLPSK